MLGELAVEFPAREKVFIALSVLLLTSIAIDQIILWTDDYVLPEEHKKPAKTKRASTRALSDDELYDLAPVEMSDFDHQVLPIASHNEAAFQTGLVF